MTLPFSFAALLCFALSIAAGCSRERPTFGMLIEESSDAGASSGTSTGDATQTDSSALGSTAEPAPLNPATPDAVPSVTDSTLLEDAGAGTISDGTSADLSEPVADAGDNQDASDARSQDVPSEAGCVGDCPTCQDGQLECDPSGVPLLCTGGTMVEQAPCDNASPICIAGSGCRQCTANDDCPQSACHFLGPAKGTCFDAADVFDVATADEFEATVGNLGVGIQAVIRMAPGVYDIEPVATSNGTEISLLGTGDTLITRSSSSQNPYTINAGSDSYLYVSQITVADGTGRAIGQASSAKLWLEDVRSYGYSYALDGAGERHIRRSHLSGDSGVIRHLGGPLFIENSSLGPSPGAALEFAMLESNIDLRFVTIVNNALSLSCSFPYPQGTVRNSILVGTNGNSIGGNSADSCRETGDLSFVDNAVDQPSYGVQVGAYQDAWFAAPIDQDFHLSPAGRSALAGIADWDPGDPTLDVDGDSRPTEERGLPGMDEF